MSIVYPTSIKTEYYNGIAWVDISGYVVSDTTGGSGMSTAAPQDRVASLGILKFTLNNVGRLFLPYGGDSILGIPTLTGFTKGAPVRITILFSTISKIFWVGIIGTIENEDDSLLGNRRVNVTCVDWFDVATRFPMKSMSITTNQRIQQGVQSILARVPIQPTATSVDVGDELFETLFHDVRDKTRAITELNKLTMSELGFTYLLQDGTLRVENNSARKGTRHLNQIPLYPPLREILELLDGDLFSLLDGDSLLLDEIQDVELELGSEDQDVALREDIINVAEIRAYPPRTATTLEVVYSLGSPITLAGNGSINFKGYYTNPSGGNSITATNLQAPVATTDYLFNTKADGTGSDITANLAVTAVYFGDSVDYGLVSSYAGTGYVIKLQARGFGIYFDSPIDGFFSDEASVESLGDTVMSIDQRYKKDTFAGIALGRSVVEQYRVAKVRLKNARFKGNISAAQMMACLYVDVGYLIKIRERRSSVTKWYYVAGRSFELSLSRVVQVTFTLIEVPSILSQGLVPIPLDMGHDYWTSINYGYCPRAMGMTQYSITAKVNLRTASGRIIHTGPTTSSALGGGFTLAVGDDPNRLQWAQGDVDGLFGVWETGSGTIPTGVEHTIVVTRDRSLDVNTDPVIYIDGTAMVLTEVATPTATQIGRNEGLAVQVGSPAADGVFKDIRIYNRVLVKDEVDMLTAAPAYTEIVTEGMVFQSHCVLADYGEAADFADGKLPDGVHVMDNIFRYVGIPNGIPLSEREWTLRTTSNVNLWGVASHDRFPILVAVGDTPGATNHILRSTDGITWSNQTSPDISVYGVCWGNGLFVAVGGNAIMTSPDGITWTSRTSPANRGWRAVTWAAGISKFVAVGLYDAGANETPYMTSADGITWTNGAVVTGIAVELVDIVWSEEQGLLVAVGFSGAATRTIYTSTNGTSWTARGFTTGIDYYGVCYSPELNLFVAVAVGGFVYTSPNGTTWSIQTAASVKTWRGVDWSPRLGIFMAVASDGSNNRSMYSTDGITWHQMPTPVTNLGWYGLCWSQILSKFVAVEPFDVSLTRAMTF